MAKACAGSKPSDFTGCGPHNIRVFVGEIVDKRLLRPHEVLRARVLTRDSEPAVDDLLFNTGSGRLVATHFLAETAKEARATRGLSGTPAFSIPLAVAAVAASKPRYVEVMGTDSVDVIAANMDKYFDLYYVQDSDFDYTARSDLPRHPLRAKRIFGDWFVTTWRSFTERGTMLITYVPKAGPSGGAVVPAPALGGGRAGPYTPSRRGSYIPHTPPMSSLGGGRGSHRPYTPSRRPYYRD